MVLDWLFVQGYDTNAFRCNLYDRETLRNWGVGWERRVALFLQKITRWMGYLCLFFGKNCWNLNKESRVTIKELEVGKDWWLCFSPSHFFLPQIPSFNIYQLTRFPQKNVSFIIFPKNSTYLMKNYYDWESCIACISTSLLYGHLLWQ